MYPNLTNRSLELEILDQEPWHYTLDEYQDCIKQLDKVGRWLGGDKASFKALKSIAQPPDSILDVGCGGGLFTIKMARYFPKAFIKGIDLNPLAISFAKDLEAPSNVLFELCDSPDLNEKPRSYDVVISTLVCHHMSDRSLVEFLQRANQIARKKVIINDLHRHPMALCLFTLICPILFPNRLVAHDGPLSIRKAFKYEDWKKYLAAANIPPKAYTIRRRWSFRWVIEIDCTKV